MVALCVKKKKKKKPRGNYLKSVIMPEARVPLDCLLTSFGLVIAC